MRPADQVKGVRMEPESNDKKPLADQATRPAPAPSFLRRRLSTDEYLGLHLTLGMLVSLTMLALFAFIARGVTGGTEPSSLDLEIGLTLRDHRLAHPLVRQLAWLITQAGSFYTLAT